jgi:hypothetical protein
MIRMESVGMGSRFAHLCVSCSFEAGAGLLAWILKEILLIPVIPFKVSAFEEKFLKKIKKNSS